MRNFQRSVALVILFCHLKVVHLLYLDPDTTLVPACSRASAEEVELARTSDRVKNTPQKPRTSEDSILIPSSPPPLEGLIIKAPHKRAVRTKSNIEEEVTKCYAETLQNIIRWGSQFKECKANQLEIMKKVKNLVKAVSNIFRKKIDELREEEYELKRNTGPLPNDISNLIFTQWENIWIEEIQDISSIWESLIHQDSSNHKKIFSSGIYLITNIFTDLEKHQLVTKESLIFSMNNMNGAKLISDYAITQFFHVDGLRMEDIYTNFDLKLSLQESPFTGKMQGLLMFLNQETWKLIEFEYITSQLGITKIDSHHVPAGFNQIKFKFGALALSNNKGIADISLVEFLEKLVIYISQSRFTTQNPREFRTKLIVYKNLYDMLRFLMRYTAQETVEKFMKKIQDLNLFEEIYTFEEAIGLLGSITHSYKDREDEFWNKCSQTHKPHPYLMDGNQNRKISSFVTQDFKDNTKDICDQEQFNERINEFDSMIQSSISETLYQNPTNIALSIKKCKEQYAKFYIHWKILLKKQSNGSSFKIFITKFQKFIFTFLTEKAKKHQNYTRLIE
ncbi:hypothetical protein PSTG_12298 [Puccinia striiformis f. sp. tritici PST-78]|uniref:Uncharacterized protein n=1 Tax=Puccinia striiformis f. sp. tritici PST-78 TaxID=1165861 RepID=A0A0L0V548_9BASI|nr:hypothetical protein PSTG_12298 [Puccinia striiformis f. sp. tritici PST-78]